MSNGMYCSASQKIDSSSSAGVMTGSEIFLTMTALPDSDATTSLVLNAFDSKTRRIASATAVPSMMAPSTMLSGGTGSAPKAATRNPFPAGFSSTALTALEPISRPTTDRLLLNRPTRPLRCQKDLRVQYKPLRQRYALEGRACLGQARCHFRFVMRHRKNGVVLPKFARSPNFPGKTE